VRTRPELHPDDVPLLNEGAPWSGVTSSTGLQADPQLTVTARS
jgi:hypothetical protein